MAQLVNKNKGIPINKDGSNTKVAIVGGGASGLAVA